MIEFTDRTIVEFNGNFEMINNIMVKDTGKTWMIRSNAVISSGTMSYEYILHFWNNGDVYIINTTHPPRTNIPNDDIVELHNWVTNNGWKRLVVNNSLIEDIQGFEFWNHNWQSGLVSNKILEEREEEEMKRFTQILSEEEE